MINSRRPKGIIGIQNRLDDLHFLHIAYERGFYAGYLRGSAFGRGVEDMDTAFKRPRSPFSRLMKHYERQLKRMEKQQ